MNSKASKFLLDILDSIKAIDMHIKNVSSLHDYSNSLLISDAVERRLAIIGEALNKCLKEDPDLIISGTKKIIGLRHIITHDYDKVDDATIWQICKINLPVLKEEINKLLIN